jgi:hypothetical protein
LVVANCAAHPAREDQRGDDSRESWGEQHAGQSTLRVPLPIPPGRSV